MPYTTAAVALTDTTRQVLYEAQQDSYVVRVIFQPLGNNGATAGRVFISSQKDGGYVTFRAREVTVPETTGTGNAAAIAHTSLPIDLYLSAGQRLFVEVGVTPTDGFHAFAVVAPNFRDFNV